MKEWTRRVHENVEEHVQLSKSNDRLMECESESESQSDPKNLLCF